MQVSELTKRCRADSFARCKRGHVAFLALLGQTCEELNRLLFTRAGVDFHVIFRRRLQQSQKSCSAMSRSSVQPAHTASRAKRLYSAHAVTLASHWVEQVRSQC